MICFRVDDTPIFIQQYAEEYSAGDCAYPKSRDRQCQGEPPPEKQRIELFFCGCRMACGDQLRSQGVWLDRRKRFVRSGIRRGRRHCFHRLFAETADFRLELDRFAAMRACFFRCRPGDGFFTAGGALIFLIFQRGIQLHQRSAGGTNKGECAGVEVRRLLSRGGRRNRGNRRGGGNDPRLGSDRRQFDFRFFLSCFRRNRDDLIASRTRGFQPRPIIFGFEFRIAVRAPEMK